MPVAIAQPVATQLSPNPMVIFDQENMTIKAIVVVSLATQNGSPLKIQAPLIAVPGPSPLESASSWKVIWTLVPGSGLQSAQFFPGVGIRIPSMTNPDLPNLVTISASARVADRPAQWQATISNGVITANSFNYDMVVTGTPTNIQLSAVTVTVHDPTIAVTKDPLDPPT